MPKFRVYPPYTQILRISTVCQNSRYLHLTPPPYIHRISKLWVHPLYTQILGISTLCPILGISTLNLNSGCINLISNYGAQILGISTLCSIQGISTLNPNSGCKNLISNHGYIHLPPKLWVYPLYAQILRISTLNHHLISTVYPNSGYIHCISNSGFTHLKFKFWV